MGCPWPSCTPAVASTWTTPTLGGESWRQAVGRVGRFLTDLTRHWNGQRILAIGHVATRWGLDHFISGVPLEDLAEQDFAWQEGWEYRIS
jgi:2,3-bisphosphoglycerate-dependent phosphoglycerate mutase